MVDQIEHDIGWAVRQIKMRKRVMRRGWNETGMFIELQVPDNHSKMTRPYAYMNTAQGDLIPWLCSQSDLIEVDWEVF